MTTLRRLAFSISLLVRDRRLPRVLRGLIALGLLPLPGPLDEVILIIAALPTLIFYRAPIREAWERAGEHASERVDPRT